MEKLNLSFHHTNPSAQHTYLALGITEERSDELIKLMNKHYQETDTISEALVRVSSEVVSPEELAFISYQFGRNIGKSSGLGGILSSIASASISIISSKNGECDCPSCTERREREKAAKPVEPVNDEAGH